MKLELKQYNKKIIIEVERDDLPISEVFVELIVPIFLAAGFGLESIIKTFPQVEEFYSPKKKK